MFENPNIKRNATVPTPLERPSLKENSLARKLHVLRNQLSEFKSNLFRRERDDLGDNISTWADRFENALKFYDSKTSNSSLENLEKQFLENLTTLLEDPISGKPLDEKALLGSDGYTYNINSLQTYVEMAPAEYKNRSPINPENADLFTTVEQPLVRIALEYLASKGIHLTPLQERPKALLFLTPKPALRLFLHLRAKEYVLNKEFDAIGCILKMKESENGRVKLDALMDSFRMEYKAYNSKTPHLKAEDTYLAKMNKILNKICEELKNNPSLKALKNAYEELLQPKKENQSQSCPILSSSGLVSLPFSPSLLARSYDINDPVRVGLEKLEGHYEVFRIKGDGHCLFRAIGASIASSSRATQNFLQVVEILGNTYPSLLEECMKVKECFSLNALKHPKTSDEIVAFLRNIACAVNRNKDLSSFLVNTTKEEYLQNMTDMERREYGGDIEIQALAELFSLQINVIDTLVQNTRTIRMTSFQGEGENLPTIELLYRPNHYDSLVKPNFLLREKISQLSELQILRAHPNVPEVLRVNVLRRRLFAELAALEKLLRDETLVSDPSIPILRKWILEFKQKIQEASFSSDEKLLEILPDELNKLFTKMISNNKPSKNSTQNMTPGILLVDALRRQSYAELAHLEKSLESNPYFNDDLVISIQNGVTAFRRGLKDRAASLQKLSQEFTELLSRILQEASLEGPSKAPASILQPVREYLARRNIHGVRTSAKSKTEATKSTTDAEKIARIQARKKAKEEAETAKVQFVAEQLKEALPEVQRLVKENLESSCKEHLDPHFQNTQEGIAAGLRAATQMEEEDQRNVGILEEEMASLEQEIQDLDARNVEIDIEVANLGDRISQAEQENLYLEKVANELAAASKELRKRRKQSIWSAVVSIGACMLGSYGLSYVSGRPTAVTPAGQGTGATMHTSFKI